MIDETDMTGKPPSVRDVEDAIAAAMKLRHPSLMMKIPPEIAVNSGNIHRCLQHLLELMTGMGVPSPEELDERT